MDMSDVITYPLSAAIELCEQLDKGTPETDKAERMAYSQEYMVDTEFARKLERERDEAREKIERQSDRIRYLEGATNHAEGTPLSVALKERDEARENLNEEMRFHHRTHSELIQTQCKLLDMEMKCDQLQDEIKRLKVILDLIKKDVS